ncbi:MAG: transcription antitermination protein NusB [Muribaculaceae bacterium]|nr:transcription antitermination protein NusB [Muribaculaceae bacterium]
MINRILIRIKVVQMLYSYLLTRKDFTLEKAPETASKDKRFAYKLYLDLILLILELSGCTVKPQNKRSPIQNLNVNLLSTLKLAKGLLANDEIKLIISREDNNIEAFDSIVLRLHSKIVDSVAFKDLKKIKPAEISDEATFWKVVINTVIINDPQFVEICRMNPDFTHVGFELGVSMLLNTLSNYGDTTLSLVSAKNALSTSFDKGYELYHSLFLLMIELTRIQRNRLESAKAKNLPSYEDLNPNMKFADNEFIRSIEEHPSLSKYQDKNLNFWSNEPIFTKHILDAILASEVYQNYMATESQSFADDCELWRSILKNIILPSEELSEILEAQSIYWNDDLEIMGTFVIKSIKHFANNGEKASFLPQFKDDEDREFGPKLFESSINKADEYRELIEQYVNNNSWDPDRLAFMDIIIMTVAITELTEFPLIPIPVTLNEYIEIANCYSTPKSGQFINGILYSIINKFKSEGKLNKV